MPRKTKEEDLTKEVKKIKKDKKTVATKTTTTKKSAVKKESVSKSEKATAKKSVPKKTEAKKKTATKKEESKKKVDTKKVESKKNNSAKKIDTEKKSTVKKDSNKKKTASLKSAASKKTTTAKPKTTTTKKTTKTASKRTSKVSKKPEIIEYYDLPYKYNKTVVKLLAQTPTTLFVYWEISDEDKEKFIKEFGEFFFNNTKPVLVIHNRTLNYSFEIDINDFANSWYLHVEDSNSDYELELGRRPINNYVSIPNDYLFISNSNEIESPNDHILFEKLLNKILFKNIKTNTTTEKAVFYYLAKIKSSYNVKDFYKTMYKDENFDFDKLTLKNPSSSSPTFK